MLPSANRCLHRTCLCSNPLPQLREHCTHKDMVALIDGNSHIRLGCPWTCWTPYLSPVVRFPPGRTVKTVASLDRTGLWALTVFISQNLSAVAAPGRLVSARHCPGHQTNPTGSRTGTPLSTVPPAKQGINHKTTVHQNGSTFTPCSHKESIIQSLKGVQSRGVHSKCLMFSTRTHERPFWQPHVHANS